MGWSPAEAFAAEISLILTAYRGWQKSRHELAQVLFAAQGHKLPAWGDKVEPEKPAQAPNLAAKWRMIKRDHNLARKARQRDRSR